MRKGEEGVRFEEHPYLPPGYRLDESDPDVLALRSSNGTAVAFFCPRAATREAIEETARESPRRGEYGAE